jgi:predicted O-methyltransferase YrrM
LKVIPRSDPAPLSEHVRRVRYRFGLLGTAGVRARQAEKSLILSADDEARPSVRLLAVALAAAAEAQETNLSTISERLPGPPYWPDIWPGEHYRLLAGLVAVEAPSVVIEIGTAAGMSALALLNRLPADGRVVTFDLVPWRRYPRAVLCEDDFADGRLIQHVDDLSVPAVAARHADLLASADLIFVDAAKDGRQEQVFLDLFERTPFRRRPIVVFDDTRQWKMLRIWRDIRRPKLDVTSFGHWSGTGLVDFAPDAAHM